ncbi:cytochrome b562 [Pseudoalteromonas sp.]|uniref:cytochrome b562 n=1 Tax=Pseudoalteromonas sp. TaxID=53249 RepID=UPI0035661416
MKFLFLVFLLVFLNPINAKESELGLVMKEMALSYKLARKAKNYEELMTHLTNIETALVKSKQIGFNRKQKESIKGIDEVLKLVREIKNAGGDLELAQKKLLKIDQLRKQYHKIHEPSFWQLIFGN